MNLDEFVRAVCPPGGNYYVEFKTRGAKPKHHRSAPYPEYNAFLLAIRQQIAQERDVWIATGSYGSARSQEQCRKKSSFYLDMDVGSGPKKYATIEAAREKIDEEVAEGHLPSPSAIVYSGNGIHIWWFLQDAVEPAAWEPVARKLKAACALYDIRADPSVTADSARIMRVPESANYKDPGDPKPVELRHAPGVKYSLATFELLFAEIDPNLATSTTTQIAPRSGLSKMVGANVGDLTNGVANQGWFTQLSQPDRLKALRQMLGFVDNNDDFDRWMRVGAALASCVGPGIAHQDTFALYYEWSRSASNYCGDDELWKRYNDFSKMNDVSVGTLIHYAQEGGFNHNNAIVHKVDYPSDYVAGKDGTFRIEMEEDGSATAHWVFGAHLKNVVVVEDVADEVLFADLCRIKAKKQTTLSISRVALQNDQAARNALWAIGIADGRELKEARMFLMAFMDMLQEQRRISRAVHAFGWTDDDEPGFALAQKILLPSGLERNGVLVDPQLSTVYEPKGSFQIWQDTTQYIIDQGRQEINALIATAFAAPLVGFTGVSGSVVAISGPETGTGKTTALKAAQSVWGCPVRGVNALDDTVNSVVKKLEMLNCLPAYWDELRIREEVSRFVKLVFNLSQGKGKSRLHASATMQYSGTWETLITCASNEPLRDHIDAAVGASTDAGQVRLFEFKAPMLNEDSKTKASMERFATLQKNYGHAGRRYAQWLVLHRAEVAKFVSSVMGSFDALLDTNNRERFWLMTISTIFAGASLANKIGILKFDLDALYRCLLDTYRQHSVSFGNVKHGNNMLTVLTDYLNDQQECCLKTDYVRAGGGPGKPAGILVKGVPANGKKTTIQQGLDDDRILISEWAFKRWVDTNTKVPPTTVISELCKLGGIRQLNAKIGAGAGKDMAKFAPGPCLLVDCTHPDIKSAFS